MYKWRDAGSPTPGDSATSGGTRHNNGHEQLVQERHLCISRQCSALSGPKHLSLPHDGHAKIVQELHLCISRQFCTVWTKTPVVATRQARQPCPGTALRISRQCSALSGPNHLSLQHDGHAKIVQELQLHISRQCSALSGPKRQCCINTGTSTTVPKNCICGMSAENRAPVVA